jgi:hypothetical protein
MGLRTSEDELATLHGPKGPLMQVPGMPAYFVCHGRAALRSIRPRLAQNGLPAVHFGVVISERLEVSSPGPRALTASESDNGWANR